MLRRYIFQTVFALVLLGPYMAGSAQAAGDKVPYSAEVVTVALNQGRAVLLEFGADW